MALGVHHVCCLLVIARHSPDLPPANIEGTYGSVVTVYNDAGEEFALKSFDPDEDNGTLELGTLREVSILRLLREENGHPNIVSLVDVQTEGEEEYSDGSFCMTMPLYSHGDLGSAIAKGLVKQGPAGRKQRVELAHGLLSSVAFLHDNHIIHRDIKSANVTISQISEKVVPVLIGAFDSCS